MLVTKRAVVTDKGLHLQVLNMNGSRIEFTKLQVGSGKYNSEESAEDVLCKRTSLKDIKQEFGISSIDANGDALTLSIMITNADLLEGYTIRELGLYARVKDQPESECLVSISLAEIEDEFPAYDGKSESRILMKYVFSVSNSDTVSFSYDHDPVALVEYVDKSMLNLSSSLETEKRERTEAENLLSARMDTFVKLAEGSTTGDAELQDIRVGSDGRIYNTAGEAVREQVGELKGDLSELYNVSDKGNFYDVNKALVGYDIVSSNGNIIEDSRYVTSDKIYMDFTKPIWIKNTSYMYAYCYGDNDVYYGRVNIETQNRYILTIYPNTKYIRLLSLVTDTNIMVMYYEHKSDTFVPYNPIEKWIEESKEVEAIKNMVVRPVKLRIASYNTGDFTGSGLTPNTLETAIEYRKTISDINADIFGFQYDTKLMNERQAYEYIFKKFFLDSVSNGSRLYDCFVFGSKHMIKSKGTIDYTEGTSLSHSFFQYCDIEINGKEFHIVNIHFEWRSVTERASQISQVISHCSNYDNCIIVGDFNPEERNSEGQLVRLTYVEDLQRFIDAGFTPCNANDDYLGVVNTIADGQLNGAWDNILVKGNIKVCSFGKLEKTYMNDHYPVYADIIVY